MSQRIGTLVTGAIWTVGGFGAGQALRVGTNIVLTRLLAPELFGLMVIVNTLRAGVELFTDVGINQNIVYSSRAEDPAFYNTAWTLRVIRSTGMFLLFVIAAIPAARFYNSPTLVYILPFAGIASLILGFESVSLALLQKKMHFAALNLYSLVAGLMASIVLIVYAYLSPTIWVFVYGGVISALIYMIGSHLLMPHLKHRIHIDKKSVVEMMSFGKWIFLGSIVAFLAGNLDRLYFGKVVPLALLGIYGIARSIADLFTAVSSRLGSGVVFPFIAAHVNMPRDILRRELNPIRSKFLLLMALGCSLFIATADLAIKFVYDARYHAAAWMLPILVIGAWFSLIVAINESTILGLGRPSYTALANSARCVLLLFALPFGFAIGGLIGSITALTLIELCRYGPIYVGQRRERLAFAVQDLSITALMFVMTGIWEFARWTSGFGTSFDSVFDSLPK